MRSTKPHAANTLPLAVTLDEPASGRADPPAQRPASVPPAAQRGAAASASAAMADAREDGRAAWAKGCSSCGYGAPQE